MTAEMLASSSVFVNGKLKVDYAGGCAYLDGQELHLTPIEYKLLCLLSKNVGKVLTHTFITQNIWGRSWDNDIASLRVFMATLRKSWSRHRILPVYPDSYRCRIPDDESGVIWNPAPFDRNIILDFANKSRKEIEERAPKSE